MNKKNCWEYKKCGREAGGEKENEFGVCPAYNETRLNKINWGKNGGRACWGIPKTLCNRIEYKVLALHLAECSKCNFYQIVEEEEEGNYNNARAIIKKLS
jgi:hypothetical protein